MLSWLPTWRFLRQMYCCLKYCNKETPNCLIVPQIKSLSHLPLQNFRLQAERSSTVIAFQLDGVICGGDGCLSVGGCLESSVLWRKASVIAACVQRYKKKTSWYWYVWSHLCREFVFSTLIIPTRNNTTTLSELMWRNGIQFMPVS